jgi:hypothetical protein
MSTLTQQVFDFWGTRTAQAIGSMILLVLGVYDLLSGTAPFTLVSGVLFLGVGLLMLVDLLTE